MQLVLAVELLSIINFDLITVNKNHSQAKSQRTKTSYKQMYDSN